jgi:hypothetical protein
MEKEVYIGKSAAINNLQWSNSNVCGGFMDLWGAIDSIEHTTAADVELVRHGKWITYRDHTYCSVCKKTALGYNLYVDNGERCIPISSFHYCPECGAKMNKE